jgi:hypothetical protein
MGCERDDGMVEVTRRYGPLEGFELVSCRWALRDSNPRPSPCKGDALPAELSARSFRVAACPADHLPEHRR